MEDKVVIKFVKTHPNAKLPQKAHPTDNCFDLYCCEKTTVPGSKIVNGEFIVGQAVIPVGLKVAWIDEGFGFATKNKSGLSFKHNLIRVAGEVDQFYRGNLDCKLLNLSNKDYTFEVGEKIIQCKVERVYKTELMLVDQIEVEEDNTRGEGGFGSSGRF